MLMLPFVLSCSGEDEQTGTITDKIKSSTLIGRWVRYYPIQEIVQNKPIIDTLYFNSDGFYGRFSELISRQNVIGGTLSVGQYIIEGQKIITTVFGTQNKKFEHDFYFSKDTLLIKSLTSSSASWRKYLKSKNQNMDWFEAEWKRILYSTN